MSDFLASQGTLKGLSNKFDGKIPVRIHFLDNSSKVFLVESEVTTVKDLVLMCLTKYGVDEPDVVAPYFAIFESKNGSSIDGALPMESKVAQALDSWTQDGVDQTAKFLFMIRLFMPCLWGLQHRDVVAFRLQRPKSALSLEAYLEAAETVDVNCLHLQFVQAVYMVITGKIPTKQEQALELAATHFLFKFGEYDSQRHQPGFLGGRIVEFVPIKHLRGAGAGAGALGSMSVEEWERKLLAKVAEIAGAAEDAVVSGNGEANVTEDVDAPEDGAEEAGGSGRRAKVVYFRNAQTGAPVSAQRRYMETIYSMVPIYGCTFFRCSQRVTRVLPEVVQVGLHHHGLGVFDKTKRLVRMFHIEDIFRWGFKPNHMFYFEISAENDMGTGSLEFETKEGKVMSDLLTDYAMAFLKEREREDERAELIKCGKYSLHATHASISSLSLGDSGLPPPPPPSAAAPPPPALAAGAGAGSTEEERRAAAAQRIQALARGFMLRNDWAREDAAILVQSVFRGYRARIKLSEMIEQLIQAGDI